MIEPVGLAAGQFALQCASRRWLDWRKRRRLASAYRKSAEETIDLCVQERYSAGSAVWNSVTSLLGSEERARQVALWYTQGRVSPNELQDMDNGNPTVSHFIQDFVVRLNNRRTDLLSFDLANLADTISERVALLLQQAQSGVSQQAGGITYWLGRPATIGDGFVGRDAELKMIGKAFEDRRVVVISGGAGTGKSRLAAEYSRGANVDGFWTTAGANALQTLAALVPSLGIPVEGGSDADTAKEVQMSLSALAPETLWVVDNVRDLDLVNELSSAVGSIQLLVTTRDARRNLLPPTVAFQAIDVLDPDPATALLCSRRRPESSWDSQDPSLADIADLVGRLPLALEMLAVRLGAPRQSPERILNQLKTAATPIELEAFQEAAGTTIPRVEGVYATIVGTLAELPAEVREQISPLGYAADAPIPDPLLGALTGLDRGEVDRLIEQCSGRSIFFLLDEQVVIHALTIAAIAATNEKGMPAATLFRVQERLSSISEADPRALRLEIAHYQNILEQTRNILGPESANVLSFTNGLATGYSALGRNDEAARLDEETLRIFERVLGPEHPHTLGSRNNLASGYRDLGHYQEALRLYEETLRIYERVLGPEHPDTLTSRVGLANGYRALGRTEDAVRLYEETLSIREHVLGSEHPDTLSSRIGVAVGYHDLGRNQDAVRLDEETLNTMERILGPEHPDTLMSRNNLATGYSALGRIEEAVRLDEETLRVRERVLGPEHPDTLMSRNNLANGYHALGRTEDTVRLYEEALSIRERVLGPEHPDTLRSRSNLALGYRYLGRYEDAVRLAEKTLGLMERVLGPEHPDTLTNRHNLASGYRALGGYEQAVRLDEEILSIRERVLGPEHPDTLTSRSNLANGYYSLGRNDEAIRLNGETMSIRERVLGPEHPDTLASRNNLAGGYHAQGRNKEAVQLDEETLRIRERVLGPEHPDTLTSRNNLAVGYRAVGRNREADELDSRVK